MIIKGSLVRVRRSEGYYYGIAKDLYEAAHNFGPVRVRHGGVSSAMLDFGNETETSQLLSALIWPADKLEKYEKEEPIAKPDKDALFDMIGL